MHIITLEIYCRKKPSDTQIFEECVQDTLNYLFDDHFVIGKSSYDSARASAPPSKVESSEGNG